MLEGIIQLLIADATVQSLVGRNKASDKYKVYPVACPQPEDNPYIVLSIINGSQFARCKDGRGDQDDTPFDVYIYAKTYKLCNDIFNAVRDVLDSTGRQTVEDVKFLNIYMDDYRDGWDKDAGDGLFVKIITMRAIVDVSPGT
jgi:hypothetical protein